MSTSQTSGRVISMAEYRAVKAAARQRSTPPTPYVLWYPGVGYLHQQPGLAVLPAAGGFTSGERTQR
jgi:hypothetical protein